MSNAVVCPLVRPSRIKKKKKRCKGAAREKKVGRQAINCSRYAAGIIYKVENLNCKNTSSTYIYMIYIIQVIIKRKIL